MKSEGGGGGDDDENQSWQSRFLYLNNTEIDLLPKGFSDFRFTDFDQVEITLLNETIALSIGKKTSFLLFASPSRSIKEIFISSASFFSLQRRPLHASDPIEMRQIHSNVTRTEHRIPSVWTAGKRKRRFVARRSSSSSPGLHFGLAWHVLSRLSTENVAPTNGTSRYDRGTDRHALCDARRISDHSLSRVIHFSTSMTELSSSFYLTLEKTREC